MTPLLEVEDLVVHFPIPRGVIGTLARRPRSAVQAVDGVSFSVDRGELLAFVGESGCGKTTTGQAALRLVEPLSGAVRFDGQDISSERGRKLRPFRRRAQAIYQDPYESLDPRFSVRQTVEEPLLVHKIGSNREARGKLVREALERAGLTPPELFLERYPHELSGGQRQRVAIAAALILEPELIIADEPVSMLDVSVRAGILGLFDQLRRDGLAIVMITHDLSTAAHYADRIAVMYLGRIVEEGPAREVVRNPRHPYTQALISVVPKTDPRERTTPEVLSGEAPNPAQVPSGCRFHPRCPAAFDRCPVDDPAALIPVGDVAPGAVCAHRAACWLVEDDAASLEVRSGAAS